MNLIELKEDIIFDGHYTLIRQLGRGGFSEVWLAHDSYMDIDVAIKIYAPGQGMDSHRIDEFRREITRVFHLNHPNLLKPQHLGIYEQMPYLVMAYCPVGSCLKRVGKMAEVELWKLICDVASGLAYLHDKDVIHQDIKPDNILVDTEGNFLITDFGISTHARSTLRKSVIGGNISGGTTAYMGPECFSRQPAPTKASDIWSFGAMAFELLEGVTPFDEIGGGMQKSGAEIPFINSPVSDALKFVILKMLSKETWERPTAFTLVEWANNPSAIQIDYSLLNPEETMPVSSSQSQSTPITNTTNETTQTEGRATQRISSVEQKESENGTVYYASFLNDKEATLILEKENKKEKTKKRTIFYLWILMVFIMLVLSAIIFIQKSKESKSLEHIFSAFDMVNNSLSNAIDNSHVRNRDLYQDIQSLYDLNPTKVEEWLEKAIRVKEESDKAFNYIQDFKKGIIQLADGKNADPEGNVIQNGGNIHVASIYAEIRTTKQKGNELKTIIDNYRVFVEDMFGNKPLRNERCDKMFYTGEDAISWLDSTFYNVPAVAVINMLFKYQCDIREIEGELIQYFIYQLDYYE